MKRSTTNVLFVGFDNTARRLLAEACLSKLGGDKFRVFFCGVSTLCSGEPLESTLRTLKKFGFTGVKLRCKDWSEFIRSGSTKMDFVVALDAESLHRQPIWTGQPETALLVQHTFCNFPTH